MEQAGTLHLRPQSIVPSQEVLLRAGAVVKEGSEADSAMQGRRASVALREAFPLSVAQVSEDRA